LIYISTAKKDKKCIICGKIIKKGQGCFIHSGQGTFCQECNDVIEEAAQEVLETFVN